MTEVIEDNLLWMWQQEIWNVYHDNGHSDLNAYRNNKTFSEKKFSTLLSSIQEKLMGEKTYLGDLDSFRNKLFLKPVLGLQE